MPTTDDDVLGEISQADVVAEFQDEVAKMRRKMARRYGRIILWKLRDLRRSWPRPRVLRLPAQARALRSVVREAQAAGLVPIEARGGRGRTSRQRRAK